MKLLLERDEVKVDQGDILASLEVAQGGGHEATAEILRRHVS